MQACSLRGERRRAAACPGRGAARPRQVQREGALADSMAVSVLLMQLYIFKFFLCAAPC